MVREEQRSKKRSKKRERERFFFLSHIFKNFLKVDGQHKKLYIFLLTYTLI
jgi:hypothetical protein